MFVMLLVHKLPPTLSPFKTYIRVAYRIFFGGEGGGDLTDDLHMYMRRFYAYILVNKSYNNAVITNDFFLLVYVIINGILGGGGGGGGGISQCPPPPLYATLYMYAH